MDLLVQKVIAEVGSGEAAMRAVAISWRDMAEGLADRETFGEEVVRETIRCALPETGLELQNT